MKTEPPTNPPPPLAIRLAQISLTGSTQVRARIDQNTVDEYAQAMRARAVFPPVVLFQDGDVYFIGDGFHRIEAATRNQHVPGSNQPDQIKAVVHKGTRQDALKYALAANSTHGLKRSNADKRRCVNLALKEWPTLSDRKLAEICAVSNNFVGQVRQLSSDDSSRRIGKDGKARRRPASAILRTLCNSNPQRKGEILTQVFNEGIKEVVVPDRDAFRKEFERWFDRWVKEGKKQ